MILCAIRFGSFILFNFKNNKKILIKCKCKKYLIIFVTIN